MHFMLPWKNGNLTFSVMKSNTKCLQVLHTRSIRLFVTMQTNQTCWKCQRSLDNQREQFFCECGVIQPPSDERTFFEVLGIKTSFDVDSRQLTQRFRQLQSTLHPDKFTLKAEEEKQISESQSALVNKAYSTLQKPLTRGLYLLELYGEPLEEQEVQVDSVFLMEIMDINEKLASASSVKVVKSIGEENRIVLQDLIEQLSKTFKSKNILTAKEILARLKYFTNIDDKVKEMLHQFASNP